MWIRLWTIVFVAGILSGCDGNWIVTPEVLPSTVTPTIKADEVLRADDPLPSSSPAPTGTSLPTCVIDAPAPGNVNLRDGAGVGYVSLRTVTSGAVVEAGERLNGWIHIKYEDAFYWINERFCK